MILRYDDPAEEAGLEALRVALAARSATGAVRAVALLPPEAMAQVARIVLAHGAREREGEKRQRAAPEAEAAGSCEHQAWEPLTQSPERHRRRRCRGCGRIEVHAPTQRGRGGWHWQEASRVSSVAADRPALMSVSGQEHLARESPRLARAMGIPVPFRRPEAT